MTEWTQKHLDRWDAYVRKTESPHYKRMYSQDEIDKMRKYQAKKYCIESMRDTYYAKHGSLDGYDRANEFGGIFKGIDDGLA
jgi:hypothetical protein